MSLLMQALRKAERARTQNGHDAAHEHAGEEPQFGADSVPLPPPIEGGPAFAVMPDAWRLEPLDAEPPVVAAQEAAHDPVPPQARHEPARPSAAAARLAPGDRDPQRTAAPPRPMAGGPGPAGDAGPPTGAARSKPALPRALASSQRRLMVLAGSLLALLAAFGIFYWRAVSAPGPGARLPMVPMPGPGAPPIAQAIPQQGAPIPVTPYVTPPGSDQGLPVAATGTAAVAAEGAASAAAAEGLAGGGAGTITGSTGNATATGPGMVAATRAPATRPDADVTIPTPEQLAAITDPAIRAEAMRDASERAARQVRAEGAAPATATMNAPPAPAAAPAADRLSASARETTAKARRPASSRVAAAGEHSAAPLKTAIGETGSVQFVRGTVSTQVAPAVQNGYTALRAGDLATAHQQYDLALLQDPNNRDALLGAAAVALREHDGRQASSNYLRLLELDPNDPEALAGLTELRPGDLQANEIKLRGLARQHPGSGPVQFALGNLFARQGRWPEAQQSYFRAFSAMPDNADYAFNLGVGLDRMNQPRLAQTYYRRALELAQASPPGFNIDAVRKRLQALETPPR